MTYNILKGASGREAQLLAVVQAVQPDILFLQEVGEESSIQQLAQATGMHYCFAQSRYGPKNLAVLSRYPFVTHTVAKQFPLFHACILATIQLPSGAPLNLYGVHVGVLYDWWRTLELQAVVRLISLHEAQHPAAYALIAGDFNAILPKDAVNLRIGTRLHKFVLFWQYIFATRWSPRILLRRQWVDGYRHCHAQADGFTFPATAPAVRLDHIFVTPTLAQQCIRCEVVQDAPYLQTASDHLPLMAEFTLG